MSDARVHMVDRQGTALGGEQHSLVFGLQFAEIVKDACQLHCRFQTIAGMKLVLQGVSNRFERTLPYGPDMTRVGLRTQPQ